MSAAPMPEPSFTLVSKMGNFISFRAKGFNHKKGDALYIADQLRAYGDARAKEARADSTRQPASLTDAQCDEFRRHPGTFNDMVRHIYRAGQDVSQEGGKGDTNG